MALINTDPRNLVAQQFFAKSADTRSPLVGALTGAIQQGRADAGQRRQSQAFGAGAQALFSGTETPEQMADLFARDPERAKSLLEGAGAFSTQGQKKLANTAFKIQNITDPNQRNQAIQQVVQQMQSGGANPSIFANLIGQSPQQQNATLKGLQLAALSVKDRVDVAADEQKFALDTAKFRLDERNIRSQIVARGRPTIPAKTSIEKNLIAAGLQPGTPEFQAQILSFIQKPVGTTVTIGDQRTLAKATEGQLASAGFADRMNNANADLSALSSGGFDPTSLTANLLKGIPGGNVLLSEEAQLYNAAKLDFITAILRKESGAAIGADEERREDIKFFPQIGDGKKTVAAKTLRRARASEILVKQSKGVYDVQYQRPGVATVGAQQPAQIPAQQPAQPSAPQLQEAPDQTGTAAISPASSVAPSGRAGGVLSVDAQGNRAFVFSDGTFEEVQ